MCCFCELFSLTVHFVDGFGAEFLMYACFVVVLVLVLIFHYVPQFGHSHVLVYIAICSLMGSLSVRFSSPIGLIFGCICEYGHKLRIDFIYWRFNE